MEYQFAICVITLVQPVLETQPPASVVHKMLREYMILHIKHAHATQVSMILELLIVQNAHIPVLPALAC